MKNKLLNTPKLKFLYSLIILFLAFFTLARLGFLAFFFREISSQNIKILPKVLLLGFRFDLRLAAVLSLPALIIINLPMREKFIQRTLHILYGFLFLNLTFLYIVDAGYFSYLKARLNSTIIQFLKNPLISFDMVRESYPWPVLAVVIFIVSYILFYLFKKFVVNQLFHQYVATRKDKIISGFIFFIFLTLSIYGSLKRYPLRWSEAFITPDSFTSNLALNPILYIADTYSFRKSDFDEEKVHQAYPIVAPLLGIEVGSANYDEKKLNFLREFGAQPEKQKNKPNFVVIIMESMGHFKTGIGGSKVNPTPYLDALAKDSLHFINFYTPTVATARSVFAAITSLPDVSKVSTGSRNPFVVNQHTNIGELTGYEKYYFLGGSANWGNIRGVLSYNIPELKIFEEGSYQSPKVDVWGISDLNLFKESILNLKNLEKGKPFFALMQSSGFHRPYTIPNDSQGFIVLTKKDISEDSVRDYGFESMDEYNAMRLQDYSLGKFFEMAKKEPWYENTIFLVFGDHSLPHNNAKNVAEWEKGQSNGYHVPLIIHSPKYIKPGINTKIASELDVMPTVAGLAGVPYKSRSLGKDLFNEAFDHNRVAFSYNWYPPFHLSLMDKDFYLEYIPYNDEGRLVKHSDTIPDLNAKEKYPEKFLEMKNQAKGLYETSKYLLHHNPHLYN